MYIHVYVIIQNYTYIVNCIYCKGILFEECKFCKFCEFCDFHEFVKNKCWNDITVFVCSHWGIHEYQIHEYEFSRSFSWNLRVFKNMPYMVLYMYMYIHVHVQYSCNKSDSVSLPWLVPPTYQCYMYLKLHVQIDKTHLK